MTQLVCYVRIKYVAHQCFHHASGPAADIMYVCMYTLNFHISQINVFYQPWEAYNLKSKGFSEKFTPVKLCLINFSMFWGIFLFITRVRWSQANIATRCSAKLFHLVVYGRWVNSLFFFALHDCQYLLLSSKSDERKTSTPWCSPSFTIWEPWLHASPY